MEYLDKKNFWYLANGLTYTDADLNVLDQTLRHFNSQTGFIDKIIEGNKLYGFGHRVQLPTNQFIVNLDTYSTRDNQNLTTVYIVRNKNEDKLPPVLHLNLRSPSLQVPQRVEIPLKYILQGLRVLEGTHMVYLHAVMLSNDNVYSYYGRTKRGWMKRYIEHVQLAMKGSNRKFPALFGKAIKARYDQLYGNGASNDTIIYAGSYHVVCSAGLDKIGANNAERYLIKKRGLNPRTGLNMV